MLGFLCSICSTDEGMFFLLGENHHQQPKANQPIKARNDQGSLTRKKTSDDVENRQGDGEGSRDSQRRIMLMTARLHMTTQDLLIRITLLRTVKNWKKRLVQLPHGSRKHLTKYWVSVKMPVLMQSREPTRNNEAVIILTSIST